MAVRSGPSPLTASEVASLIVSTFVTNDNLFSFSRVPQTLTLILKHCHFLPRASILRYQVAAGPFYKLPLTGLYSFARCSNVTLHTAASGCYRADSAQPPHRPLVLHAQLPHSKNSSIHQCRLLPGIFPNQQFGPSGKLLHMDTSKEPLGPYLPDMP